MGAGVLVAGTLFVLWSLISQILVSPQRLADSTIPHILTARSIAGETGRYIIGATAIAGACAAANLLLSGVARMAIRMAACGILPGFMAHEGRSPWLLTGLAGLVGLSMFAGFAGSQYIFVVLRAGLVLWLVLYAMIHLAHWIDSRQKSKTTTGRATGHRMWPHLIHGLCWWCVVLGLLLLDRQPAKLAVTVSAIVIAAFGVALVNRLGTKSSCRDRAS